LVAVGREIHRSGDYMISDVVNAAVWVSVDGLTWMRVPHDEAAFADSGMNSVTAGGRASSPSATGSAKMAMRRCGCLSTG